jgi:hypothetical protein
VIKQVIAERFLALAEEAAQERRDVVCQGLTVEITIQGVVAVLGAETNFDIVLSLVMTFQNISYFVAEVSFYFQNQT